MKQQYLLTLSLTIVLLLGFCSFIKTHGQSQIIVGPPTPKNTYFETEYFNCSGICRISWEAGHYGSGASFYFDILQVGEPAQRKASCYGLRGKTYFYSEGTFYFQVYAYAGIRSWHIQVEQMHIGQLDPQTTFIGSAYGDREVNTEIFRCSGYCIITWATEYDPSRSYRPANITISINKLGIQDPIKTIYGYCTGPSACYDMNGSTDLKGNGIFHFSISANRIYGWEIFVEDTPLVPEGNYLYILVGGLFGWVFVMADVQRPCRYHSKL